MRRNLILAVVCFAVVGCSGYTKPNERSEVAHGVVAPSETEHAMKVKEQRKVIETQDKILKRQHREYMDAKRQEEQNERLKRYGSEKDLSTFEGY